VPEVGWWRHSANRPLRAPTCTQASQGTRTTFVAQLLGDLFLYLRLHALHAPVEHCCDLLARLAHPRDILARAESSEFRPRAGVARVHPAPGCTRLLPRDTPAMLSHPARFSAQTPTHLPCLGPRARGKRGLSDDELALLDERLLVEGILGIQLALGQNCEARLDHVCVLDNGHGAGAHRGARACVRPRGRPARAGTLWRLQRAGALGDGARAEGDGVGAPHWRRGHRHGAAGSRRSAVSDAMPTPCRDARTFPDHASVGGAASPCSGRGRSSL